MVRIWPPPGSNFIPTSARNSCGEGRCSVEDWRKVEQLLNLKDIMVIYKPPGLSMSFDDEGDGGTPYNRITKAIRNMFTYQTVNMSAERYHLQNINDTVFRWFFGNLQQFSVKFRWNVSDVFKCISNIILIKMNLWICARFWKKSCNIWRNVAKLCFLSRMLTKFR